ncbi:MAG: hypothetical protein JWQ14_1862 [Adhaeribacter sp.]|nr:hypothetical protein [Adhaeribacter sp.]
MSWISNSSRSIKKSNKSKGPSKSGNLISKLTQSALSRQGLKVINSKLKKICGKMLIIYSKTRPEPGWFEKLFKYLILFAS